MRDLIRPMPASQCSVGLTDFEYKRVLATEDAGIIFYAYHALTIEISDADC
jgi:hypothetical protein